MTWDVERVAIYLNGQGGRSAGDGTSPMVEALKPHDLLTFDRQAFASFFVGGDRDARQFDGLIDDLRIYSAPLAPEQIREIWRRAQVIELKAQGLYALADTPGTLTVTATSPAGCDLAGLKYCRAPARQPAGGRLRAQGDGRDVVLRLRALCRAAARQPV